MLTKFDTGSALQKAMAILDVVARETHSIGIPDIAARLDLPRQTVHRVVRQMLEMGLLHVDPSRERYGIGPVMEALAIDVMYSSYRRGPVHAILEQLVAATGETCSIGVLDGHEVISLDRIETSDPFRVQMREGSRLPAHATAIGKVLIANLPANGRRRFVAAAPLHRFTAQTITEAGDLENEIGRIRQCGYALSESEYMQGLVGAAVPLIVDEGKVIAAIGTNAPSARKSLDTLVEEIPLLLKAAQKVQEINLLREVNEE